MGAAQKLSTISTISTIRDAAPALTGRASYIIKTSKTFFFFLQAKINGQTERRPNAEKGAQLKTYKNRTSFTETEVQLIVDSLQAYYRYFNKAAAEDKLAQDKRYITFIEQKQEQIQKLRNQFMNI